MLSTTSKHICLSLRTPIPSLYNNTYINYITLYFKLFLFIFLQNISLLQKMLISTKLSSSVCWPATEADLILRLRLVLRLKKGEAMARFSHLITVIYFIKQWRIIGKWLCRGNHEALWISQWRVCCLSLAALVRNELLLEQPANS